MLVLFSAPESYGPSQIVGHYVDTNMKSVLTASVLASDETNYGQINAMWVFSNTATNATAGTTGLMPTAANYSNRVVFTGIHDGKGMVGAFQLGQTGTGTGNAGMTQTSANQITDKLLNDATSGVSVVHDTFIREIRSPGGGVMQFKGLAQSTTNDQYVEVNCTRIEGFWE